MTVNHENLINLLHEFIACKNDMGIDDDRVYDLIERAELMLDPDDTIDSCMDCRMPVDRCIC